MKDPGKGGQLTTHYCMGISPVYGEAGQPPQKSGMSYHKCRLDYRLIASIYLWAKASAKRTVVKREAGRSERCEMNLAVRSGVRQG
jgi:hypothetical protein